MTRVLSAVAWPYANGPRHIGHVAGFGVPSDVFSRAARMAGHEVLMISGTDEHGTPILVQAEQDGVSPQALADRYNRVIVEDLHRLGLSYDLFTRTTTRNHYQVVQEMFRQVYKNGYLVERTTKGAVSPSTGRTLPDRFIEGTCPICGDDSARGDQCDNCGNQLDPVDLISPRSRINGETPKFIETEHLFLDLPALTDALATWLGSRSNWRPNVLRFSLNLLDEVKPRAMTRDIDWGIPVPLPTWEDQSAKRIYVWFDAVVGYLSASIEWARRRALAGQGDSEEWRQWWNNPEAQAYYFMGKDNITFHSQIWPAELLGYDGEGSHGGQPGRFGRLQLPTEVVSSEFLTMEGKQFSSSRGVVIYVCDLLERYQPDALRYFIAVAGPENQDSDFTWAEFKRRNNDELVAAWGNLVNRTVNLIHKNLGAIPAAHGPEALEQADRAVLAATEAAFTEVSDLIARHRQKAGITAAMKAVAQVNAYLAETAPWKLAKGDDAARLRMASILHTAAQAVSDCNTLLAPYLPHAAQAVDQALGFVRDFGGKVRIEQVTDLDDPSRSYPILTGDYGQAVPRWRREPIPAGQVVPKPSPVFAKLDDSVVEEELDRLRSQG
ncbi:MAG: methionine--tRNA ligase [Micrococcales bacterium]|nr:methionine--tRNA ligase [Micrococcales bacterium]